MVCILCSTRTASHKHVLLGLFKKKNKNKNKKNKKKNRSWFYDFNIFHVLLGLLKKQKQKQELVVVFTRTANF